jgi:uncharacterized protein with ATP-grasp and redox domains
LYSLQTACKLSIAGNAIDLGAQAEYPDMNTIIEESLNGAFDLDCKDMYNSADVIIAKGHGNYESLCNRSENIFFLFKVKCPIIARDSGYDIDTLVLIGSRQLREYKNLT